MLKIASLKYAQILLTIWAISLQRKKLSFFSHLLRYYPLIVFTTLKAFSHSLYFKKNLLLFSFYLSYQRNKRALSYVPTPPFWMGGSCFQKAAPALPFIPEISRFVMILAWMSNISEFSSWSHFLKTWCENFGY